MIEPQHVLFVAFTSEHNKNFAAWPKFDGFSKIKATEIPYAYLCIELLALD